jgi:hypothetical protein
LTKHFKRTILATLLFVFAGSVVTAHASSSSKRVPVTRCHISWTAQRNGSLGFAAKPHKHCTTVWRTVSTKPTPTPTPVSSRGPLMLSARLWPSVTRWAPLIFPAARANGLDPSLVGAVIEQESGGNNCVYSSAGAVGLMQLEPATAAWFGFYALCDPATNIAAGCRYLAYVIHLEGSVFGGLEAYNAGPGNIGAGYTYAQEVLARL